MPIRPFSLALLALLCACWLSACTGEDLQRRAFIRFLQAQIIGKPGVHVAPLTDEENTSFGNHNRDYAVLEAFHTEFGRHAQQPLAHALAQLSFTSLSDVLQRKDALLLARDHLDALPEQITTLLNTAQTQRQQLNQSEDLQTVYALAYSKVISQPTEAIRQLIPRARSALTCALDVLTYIEAHPDTIKIRDSVIEVSEPALQQELSRRLQRLNEEGQAVIQAQRTFINLTYGH